MKKGHQTPFPRVTRGGRRDCRRVAALHADHSRNLLPFSARPHGGFSRLVCPRACSRSTSSSDICQEHYGVVTFRARGFLHPSWPFRAWGQQAIPE